jgi:calcineurin-like phosphoesterase family protein
MDSTLISRWNVRVKPEDDIWFLGDFARPRAKMEEVDRYFSQLNGHINFIPGGHDVSWMAHIGKRSWPLSKNGQVVHFYPPLYSLQIKVVGKEYPLVIVLCHYAMRVWDRSHYNSYHLYGHSHGKLYPFANSKDVGCDVWNYPVSLGEVLDTMEIDKKG